MNYLHGVRRVALVDDPQVVQADGLLNGELAGNAGDVDPGGEFVNRNEGNNRSRDGLDSTVGHGLLGVRPDNKEARLRNPHGGHGQSALCLGELCGGRAQVLLANTQMTGLRGETYTH
jgi:hypothetical protein